MARTARLIPASERARIIRAVRRGVSQSEIARKYGVTRQYVHKIVPASVRQIASTDGKQIDAPVSRTALAARQRWDKIQRMRKRGMKEKSIAHALGITPSALSDWLTANRLPTVGAPTPRARQSTRQRKLAEALKMYQGGMSVQEAADACGVTIHALTAARRKAGLPSRWKRLDVAAMMQDYQTMTAIEVAQKHNTTPQVVYQYVTITGAKRGKWASTRAKKFEPRT